MKDESGTEQVEASPRPAKKRRWWLLWGWAPVVVVVIGMVVLHWYAIAPATYRLIGHCTIAYPFPLRCTTGVLLQEDEYLFVFRDLEGRERWRVNAPIPASFGYPDVGLSLDGRVCAITVNEPTDYMIYTWRDGKPAGAAHIPVSRDQPIRACRVRCADDGSVFTTVTAFDGTTTTYLVQGDQFVAQGITLYLEGCAIDQRTLIDVAAGTVGYCSYDKVLVKGRTLSISPGPMVAYDSQCDFINEIHLRLGQEHITSDCWYDDGHWERADVTPHWTATMIPSLGRTITTASRVTIAHRDTKAAWTLALPRYTTAVEATADDRHALVGHGYFAPNKDVYWWFRSWPVVGRLLPVAPPRRTDVCLSLYNESGRCEARLSYDAIQRMEAHTRGAMPPYEDDRIFVIASSNDGTRLVLLIWKDIYFLQVEPHRTA